MSDRIVLQSPVGIKDTDYGSSEIADTERQLLSDKVEVA